MYVCTNMYVGDLGVRALKKSPKSGKYSVRGVCASGERVAEGCRFAQN